MTSNESGQSPVAVFYQNTLLVVCAAGSLLLIGWLLKYSAYGFDFTDESFYLNSMVDPFLYAYSHTQFGFIYHPIYHLLGGDIVKLRQANILTNFGLAWCLAYVFLTSLAPETKYRRSVLLVVAAGLATSVLIVFDWWLLTPSYNSLNLQALLITAIGLVLSDKSAARSSLIGWSLIGVGGWMAFMAKPSTALALAFGVCIYLWFARKFSSRLLLLAITVSTALLCISAILIDGSIFAFAQRMQRAMDFGQILGSGHTLVQALRIDSPRLSGRLTSAIVLISFALGASILGIWSNKTKWSIAGWLMAIVLFAITALLTLGFLHWNTKFGQFQALLIFGLVFAVASASLMLGKRSGLKNIATPQRAMACLFFATPHIYAFGTNGNYWWTGGGGGTAAIFWLFAGLTLLQPLIRARASWGLLLPVAIAAQSVTTILLQAGFEQPYRQPQPIWRNDTALTFGAKASTLILPGGYAEYISGAVFAAKHHEFEAGTPVIDLSGQSPGLLYALGAESIGQAWNVGAYPGSLRLAQAALHDTPCEKIAAAWILLEPDGPRSISNRLMHGLGSEFPKGYIQVATWKTAEGAGGYSNPRIQALYKPVAIDEMLNRCNRLRMHSGT